MQDPRLVITYGAYVGPGKTKDSIGSWVAFLSVYAGLQEADYGQATGSGGYRLRSGVIAKHRGTFEHPLMGWVPLFDFTYDYEDIVQSNILSQHRLHDLTAKASTYEHSQSIFLKKLLLNEFPTLD